MYVLPPVVIVLAISGALYMFNEVWPQNEYEAGGAAQAFQRAYGTRAQLSAREQMAGRPEDLSKIGWVQPRGEHRGLEGSSTDPEEREENREILSPLIKKNK